MATKEQKAREAGIEVRTHGADYRTPCPKCSPDRRKKKDPCLHITITGGEIKAFCHHCEWGVIFDDDDSRRDRTPSGSWRPPGRFQTPRPAKPAALKRWW